MRGIGAGIVGAVVGALIGSTIGGAASSIMSMIPMRNAIIIQLTIQCVFILLGTVIGGSIGLKKVRNLTFSRILLTSLIAIFVYITIVVLAVTLVPIISTIALYGLTVIACLFVLLLMLLF